MSDTKPGGVPALRRFGALVIIAAILVIAWLNSNPTTTNKTAKLDGPSVAERQARKAQSDKDFDYIIRTSRTKGEATRRVISEGFWSGFADGMAGK